MDLRTFTARVTHVTAVQEVGKVLHPVLATGQVCGGVAQAIGWALTEECRLQDGSMSNARMNEYLIPTSLDVPPIRVVFVEGVGAPADRACKGLGELAMDGPAPAIASAISRALAIEANVLPLSPSRLMEMVLRGPSPRRVAPDPGSHRRKGRVCRGRVRGMHRADGRATGKLLPRAGVSGTGTRGRHRGIDEPRGSAPAAHFGRHAVRRVHTGSGAHRAAGSAATQRR